MTQHARALQVPFHTEVDGDGVTMTVCRLDRTYYAKIKFQMKNGTRISSASILPFLVVHAAPETPDVWRVSTRPRGNAGRTDATGMLHFRVDAPGRYRAYIKEPTEILADGDLFVLQEHALADGSNSGRAVQALIEFTVMENQNCTLSVRKTHPNGLSRTRGTGNDSIAEDGPPHQFAEEHANDAPSRALDLGTHIISFQLWADASRTYGPQHHLIQNSRFRDALNIIYGEQLTNGVGTGDAVHDRTLSFGDMEVVFNHQATTGGRDRLSFQEDNGQPGNRMTADEALRRTHPATMEFLLRMMEELNITYARSTGAWRPHIGSTRHRYASAIDLTHVRTVVIDARNQQHQVTIHFNSAQSSYSNPLQYEEPESAARTRMREFSHRFHTYIASARSQRTLGWLGGPWPLTYRQLGIAATDQFNNVDGTAIATDATHSHHIHISFGTDQP